MKSESTLTMIKKPEVCELLGITQPTLDKWVRNKAIRHYRLNGVIRFRLEDVEQFLKDNLVEAA